jgi:hypothetical protein
VDLNTSALPDGWHDRLVKVQNENTAAPSGQPQFIGWCLDKEDLCVAKLCALREKDQNFVDALITANLVDPQVIATRLATTPRKHRKASERAAAWLAHRLSTIEWCWTIARALPSLAQQFREVRGEALQRGGFQRSTAPSRL